MKIIMEIIPDSGSAINVTNPNQQLNMERGSPAVESSIVQTYDGGYSLAFKTTGYTALEQNKAGYNAGMFKMPAKDFATIDENQFRSYIDNPMHILDGGMIKFKKK